MRARRVGGLGALLLLLTASASAESTFAPELTAYPGGVRFDQTGQLIEATREDGPRTVPALGAPVRLRAVRDEVVSIQVLARRSVGGSGAGVLSVRVSPFVDARQKPARIVSKVFEQRDVTVKSPSTGGWVLSLGARSYPDILLPTSTITVSGDEVGRLWLDFWVPPATRPGVYSATLGVGDAQLGLEIDVLDMTLPEADVARLGAVSFGSFLERERQDPALFRRWMQLAHAHHLSIDLLTPPLQPEFDAERGLEGVNWAAWALRVAPYVRGTAFTFENGYVGPREGQPVSRWTIPVTERWPTERTEKNLPSDPALFSEALAAWEKLAIDEGWFDIENATEWVLFINGLDEPHEAWAVESLLEYEAMIERAGLVDRSHARFRVDGPFGQKIPGWSDARLLEELGRFTDVWNVCGAKPWVPWALLEERRRTHPEEQWMFYASNTAGEPAIGPAVVDSPPLGLRAWGWIVWRYRLAGALNWEVDIYPGCVEDPHCSEGGMNLDATLIYRGEEVGARTGEPIASMRLKMLRRGAQDAALLEMLAERSPTLATQVARAVVPSALGDDQPVHGAAEWPQDPVVWARARGVLLDGLSGQPTGVREIRPPTAVPRRVLWMIAWVVLVLALVWIVRAKRKLRGSG